MLDADIIIHLHRAGLWEAIVTAYQVVIPSIIIDEARFYLDDQERRHPIDLLAQVEARRITQLSASIDELAALCRCLSSDLLEGLHPGELEALALVLSGRYAQGRLCSGDALALTTLSALGYEQRGVSLEEVLQAIGSSLDRRLRENRRRRMTGQGVTITPWERL